ncbi:MAG TPA: M42 family metallopeptidase [Caulobacteraceae bacterium]|jgi:endoglucanase|nr:M42 family metallopeptidase [Caulobacteraceae bacterium]
MKTIAILAVAAAVMAGAGAHAEDRTEALLRELSNAPGPPGAEEPVRAIMARELHTYASKITYDGMGSLIAQHGTAGPRVMLDAHMDELGAMVRRVTPDGFVTIQMLGGWLDEALPGQRWVILTAKGPVHAVSGIRDVHVTPTEERAKPFNRDNLFLDIGARSPAEAATMGVEPGDPVAPDSSFEELASGRYAGKAWDDRVGCAVLIEALKRLAAEGHPNQVFVAATTQEEIGLRGAHTAAQLIGPDIGIAIEGGMAGDQPGTHPDETNGRLGGGPDLFLYDSSALANRKLVAFVRHTAAERQIPVQLDLVQGYGDDSAEIQKTAGGAPTINIGVPVRYMHVHTGVIDRKDFDATVDLVVAIIRRLDAPTVAGLRDFAP